MKYWLIAAESLQWLVLVGGAVALVARRRRAPRAVSFAIPVVGLLAMCISGRLFLSQFWLQRPRWPLDVVFWGEEVIGIIFCVLLPVIAMTGRHRKGHDDH